MIKSSLFTNKETRSLERSRDSSNFVKLVSHILNKLESTLCVILEGQLPKVASRALTEVRRRAKEEVQYI